MEGLGTRLGGAFDSPMQIMMTLNVVYIKLICIISEANTLYNVMRYVDIIIVVWHA